MKNYDEIRHALKCCWLNGMCKECPYNGCDDDIEECTSELARETMILLESLKRDNDRLLKSLNITQQEQYTNGRNDGIREFAEKMKEMLEWMTEPLDEYDIDNIVKEMAEDENEKR